MLKIQLEIYYWESGKPASLDRRRQEHGAPIFAIDLLDMAYFQTLFSALKGGGATFDPSPSGTLVSFSDHLGDFDYADGLFSHPRARDDVYSAAMISFGGRLWIALFDDGRRVADYFLDSGSRSSASIVRLSQSTNVCSHAIWTNAIPVVRAQRGPADARAARSLVPAQDSRSYGEPQSRTIH